MSPDKCSFLSLDTTKAYRSKAEEVVVFAKVFHPGDDDDALGNFTWNIEEEGNATSIAPARIRQELNVQLTGICQITLKEGACNG